MRQGFSLVELSIVLVILGLLTGGILAGQSLIRASEIRAVSAEYARYVTAARTFRDKYFAIPGDMNNAQTFWGSATCPGTSASPSTSAATCNGNGDGVIVAAATTSNEVFRAWQHLANAGLIEGSYSGVPNSVTYSDLTTVLGTNAPASKLTSAGWTVYTTGSTYAAISSLTHFEGTYGNYLLFGAVSGTSLTQGAVLKPEEAWNIDTKLDDGKPGLGNVVTREDASTCQDQTASGVASVAAAASYILTTTSATCILYFKNAF